MPTHRPNPNTTGRSRWRGIAAAGLSLAMLAAACTSDEGASGDPDDPTTPVTNIDGDDIVLTSALLTFDGCGDLLAHLKSEATERVGPWGLDPNNGWWGWGFGVEEEAMEVESADMAMDDTAAVTTTQAADGDAATSGTSGTNNQEAEVDEADRVKTDGDRLVVSAENTLRVLDITGDEPVLERTIDLPDGIWGGEFFLDGDTLLLMTSGWTETPLDTASDIARLPYGMPTAQLHEIDLRTGDVVRTLTFEGGYLSAREIDGTVRVVLHSAINRFPWLFPSNEGANEAATEFNRELIESSTIEDWLPTFQITDEGGTVASGTTIDCERVHAPADFAGFGMVSVLSIDLDRGLELLDASAVVTNGQTVYASTDQLVVATARWPEMDPMTGEFLGEDDGYRTDLHAFDISDTTRSDYLASGSVRGSMLSQFSLSEHNGILRVATTDGGWWSRNGEESESFVTTFDVDGDELVELGQVGGLGLGEQIFSVRFLGEIAYVVTFRQIDPLYTVDLTDPANPVVRGELKIPGFSTYLHPLDDGKLLGVGQDATDEGRTLGTQVSLFDVSDLDNPTRVSTLGFDDEETSNGNREFNRYSPIDWDHRAFTWWNGEAFIPTSWWGWDPATQAEDNGTELIVVGLDGDTLVERGRVAHPGNRFCESNEGVIVEPLPVEPAEAESAEAVDAEEFLVEEDEIAEDRFAEEWCWTYTPEIQRTVIDDGVLYTISDTTVSAWDLETLEAIGDPIIWDTQY